MMAAIRKMTEKWRVHRERKKRLNAARNANPDTRGDYMAGSGGGA